MGRKGKASQKKNGGSSNFSEDPNVPGSTPGSGSSRGQLGIHAPSEDVTGRLQTGSNASRAAPPLTVGSKAKDNGQTTNRTQTVPNFQIGTPDTHSSLSNSSALTDPSYEILTETSYGCSGISRTISSTGSSTHSLVSNLSPFVPESEGQQDGPTLCIGDSTEPRTLAPSSGVGSKGEALTSVLASSSVRGGGELILGAVGHSSVDEAKEHDIY